MRLHLGMQGTTRGWVLPSLSICTRNNDKEIIDVAPSILSLPVSVCLLVCLSVPSSLSLSPMKEALDTLFDDCVEASADMLAEKASNARLSGEHHTQSCHMIS